MNDKLSLQDLVDLLSKKAKITKKDADSFYRELFQLVLDRIFENDSVKIKDFGTFKLISVSSRESVNVNTGEKIEIPSHYKLSFIPDKVLKNLVNKPFSQFETILLEDGVIFETSVDNNESVSEDELPENEDAELENEDADLAPEIEQSIIEDIAPVIAHTTPPVVTKDTQKTSEGEIPSKPQASSKQQIYPQSFVYTYTTSKPSDEPASITLTLPREDVRPTPVPPVEEKEAERAVEAPVEEVPEEKEFIIDLLDLPHIPSEDEEIEANSKDDFSIADDRSEIDEIAQETVLESVPLSTTLPKLPKSIISDDLELESDFDSEIETEEDVIIPIPIVNRHEEENEPSINSTVPDKLEVEKSRVFSDEDPERPLFPNDDADILTDTNFVPLHSSVDEEVEVVTPPQNHQPNDIGSSAGDDDSIETDNELFFNVKDPDGASYQDFNAPSGGFQWRKWLPVMIFVAVIMAFLAYGLVKMLNKPYGFEHNLNRTNFSLSDSLPFVDEKSPEIEETDALLDSIKNAQGQSIQEPVVEPLNKEAIVPIAKQPAVEEKVEAVTADITGETDSLTREALKSEKSGFVISDKLKFGILNKAGFHLEKYKTEESPEVMPDPQGKTAAVSAQNTKPQYDSIKRGTTLRTLATTHYGRPEYWVYIYQANTRNIANPNNVPIGTTLLIPALSAYGVANPKDAKAIQTAKNLESKILRGR